MDQSDKLKKESLRDSKKHGASAHAESQSAYTSISDDLIRKIAHEIDFSKITVLNFHQKLKGDIKIKKIEGLSRLTNLEELNLSYNLISSIENLDHLKRLKDLNLAENNIKKIENIEGLVNLEKFNLSGNMIQSIPESIKALKKLHTFRLSRNRVQDLEKLTNIRYLPALKQFSISDNPINMCPGHIDFCIYLNPRIEVIDSRKVTSEYRKAVDQLFMLTQGEENRDIDRERQGEIHQLKENEYRLGTQKERLKEENHTLKKIIQEQEDEINHLKDVIDKKNKELSANFEKLSLLEQEISQYKIDSLYAKFGTTEENEVSSFSKAGHEEISRIEKLINSLLTEKKEGSNRLEKLQQIQKKENEELSQVKDKIKKLNHEIGFMNKKFMMSSGIEKSSPEKSRKDKELKLASHQVQAEQLREQSLDLQTNIEGVKEKIRKTCNLLERANNSHDQENDKSAMEDKLKQLHEKLREYEKSNDEIISAIASSNREIRNLTEEIYSEKKTNLSSSRGSRYGLKSSFAEDENKDMLKAHYESDIEQLNQLKQRETELTEKNSKTSSQVKELTQQVTELDERIHSLQRDRSSTEQKIQSIHLEQSVRIKNQNVESVKLLKPKLLALSSSVKQLMMKTEELTQEGLLRRDITSIDDVTISLGKESSENIKGMESNVQKICNLFGDFKEKLVSIIVKKQQDHREYEIQLQALQGKIQEATVKEKNIQEQISQKENKFTKVVNDVDSKISKKETRLEQISSEIDDLQDKKEQISEMINRVFEKVDIYKNKLNSIQHIQETETDDWESEENDTQKEDWNKMINKLKKVFKLIENNLNKMENFAQARSQFLQEFEKETKELGEKWRDFEAKKIKFKQKMNSEKEENLRKIKEEYLRLEEECKRFEEKKRVWMEEKKRIEQEKDDMINDISRISYSRDQVAEELRKDQEQKVTIKESYDNQVFALKKQIHVLTQEIQEYEAQKEGIIEEFNQLIQANESEVQRYHSSQENMEKLERSYQKLAKDKEELDTQIQNLKKEREGLVIQTEDVKTQLKQVEDDFKLIIEKLKAEERGVKRSLEDKLRDLKHRNEDFLEVEEQINSLNEQIMLKRNEFNNIEKKIEEFAKEKETNRKIKLENAQLAQDMEEAQMNMQEIIFKINLHEESLQTAKNQIESTNLVLKEKQNEVLVQEKKLNKLHETINDSQIKLTDIQQEYSIKEEQIREFELKNNELLESYERICHNLEELEPNLSKKEAEFEGILTELNQKEQELQELNEMIQENDSKYRKIIKENREALDRTLVELREKEEEYHKILVEFDKLAREKEETQNIMDMIENETQNKEDILRKMIETIKDSQDEALHLNENIINLTEKENEIEERLQKFTEVEHAYSNKIIEIENSLASLMAEEQELSSRVSQLQQKEDSILVLMALNGDNLNERSQERIKKMVNNHIQISELKAQVESLQNENAKFKKHQQGKHSRDLEYNHGYLVEKQALIPQINYRLNFASNTSADQLYSSENSSKEVSNHHTRVETENKLTEPMPLRETTRDNINRPSIPDTKTYHDKSGEEIEDLYHFTTEDTNDVRLVLQKIEDARKHINLLEKETKKHQYQEKENENEPPFLDTKENQHQGTFETLEAAVSGAGEYIA